MPDESGWTPNDDKPKTKNQGNPLVLVFFAIGAYIAGAPIIFSIFMVVVAIFVWRKQVALKSLNKMPPLPKNDTLKDPPKPLLEEVKDILAQAHKELNEPDQLESPTPFNFESDWGRPEPQAQAPIFLPVEPPPSPATQTRTTSVQPARRRTRNAALSFRRPQHLRQAMIAMTVLGPCRTQQPYQDPLLSSRTTNEPAQSRQTNEG